MKPRYRPTYKENGREVFLGHIGELDIYHEWPEDRDGAMWVIIVGPVSRKTKGPNAHNYDIYDIENGCLVPDQTLDLHIYPHEMCELYRLLIEKGYINETEA